MGWKMTADIAVRQVRVTLCGPTRSGKTTIAASFPRPAFIQPRNENSVVTLSGYGNYPYVEIGSMAEMNQTLDELLAWQKQGQLSGFCETIVADNLSHYSEIVELELTKGGAQDLNWDAYNMHFKRIREVLFQLNAHVVFTMLDKVKTDKRGNVLTHGPRLYGSCADLMVSSCDVVAYCEQTATIPPQWQAHVQQAGLFCAGSRLPGMPLGIYPNFNFPEHIAPHLKSAAAAAAE